MHPQQYYIMIFTFGESTFYQITTQLARVVASCPMSAPHYLNRQIDIYILYAHVYNNYTQKPIVITINFNIQLCTSVAKYVSEMTHLYHNMKQQFGQWEILNSRAGQEKWLNIGRHPHNTQIESVDRCVFTNPRQKVRISVSPARAAKILLFFIYFFLTFSDISPQGLAMM